MTKADTLLLAVLCGVIGLLFQRHWISPSPATQVRVTSESGTLIYALDQAQSFQVDGPLGASTLDIHDHAVRFLASPCRHQVCVRSGWHKRSGAVAACVPNRISLTLTGGAADFDGYSY